MRTCSQIAECSLAYAKIMPTSAMRVHSQIAECSLAYANLGKNLQNTKEWGKYFFCRNRYIIP